MSEPRTIAGNACVVHAYHYPVPARTVQHHIHPLEYNGPNVASNKVWICDTGHYAIHEYINAALKGLHWSRKISRKDKELAERGLAAIRSTLA